ncbi:hypothetical protein L873DRAFT_48325 [Choiromyces venosus 120613-1]|uniref:Uncharacterized protein n=1 Tax=Choiromyces venosus 120613-1 TaxID=1336337 RepID=A0A3N4K094_9PEZI|nr:hypothetical protein L873DRAFT_48325 [Choiromyces venosus 120613-1]
MNFFWSSMLFLFIWPFPSLNQSYPSRGFPEPSTYTPHQPPIPFPAHPPTPPLPSRFSKATFSNTITNQTLPPLYFSPYWP